MFNTNWHQAALSCR